MIVRVHKILRVLIYLRTKGTSERTSLLLFLSTEDFLSHQEGPRGVGES